MTDDELAAIEARVNAATDGPWIDLTRTYFERCLADRRTHGRWYHGSERASKPLVLIAQGSYHGDPLEPDQIPRQVDKFDLRGIISLFWGTLPKRTTVATEGFMRPKDAAFIAAARTDVPALVAEVRRLRALLGAAPLMLEALEANEEVARLQKPFIAGLNAVQTTSHEVMQETSDRLAAAQRRWWGLRKRALAAARGTDG